MLSDIDRRPNRPAAVALIAVTLSLFGYFVAWLPWHEGQQPVTEAEQEAMDRQLAANSDRLKSMLDDRLAVTQMSEERLRQESQLGRELSLRCLQWTDLHDSQPSDKTERFQELACKRYNHYVTTGELLDAAPPPDEELL